MALAMGFDLTFISPGWIRMAMMIATMISITVSGFRISEGSLIRLLKSYGIARSQAVAYSSLIFSRLLFIGIIGGFIELYALFGKKKSNHSGGTPQLKR